VRAPIPPISGSGSRKPKRARLGIVCTTPAIPRTGRASFGRRVRAMPSGIPAAEARTVETATSVRCCAVSARISARRSQK
jgi:hypothetical protein